MLIAMTKKPTHLENANYDHFAAGTVSDVWFDEDWQQDEEQLEARKTLFKSYDA